MEEINKAIAVLHNGGVVIFPTDTVYGFLADATNKKAVESIYLIKKRLKSKPLPVFVKDFNMAKELAEIDEKQEKNIKKYWPGKYTFILKRKVQSKKRKDKSKNLELYGVDEKTIAIRIPKYKILNDLLEKINKPLVQTSVNISGEESITKIKDIIKNFENEGVLVINGGDIKKSKPSKIIDLTGSKIKNIR